ncbi:VOC family protein [Kitasatospora sp. RG8]|uniref:VOC family protein n=1 Tax=Kitasatospora sp. RG8 TaxID=2820815 RepID=UPI001AE00C73|nr:VOC family protein [Kitasatospora sp. RG8]MBP0452155.1 VOC family protein [Kitasatospora sp. RG8]
MLKNLMYVAVYVTDQDRALSFYTEGLGLNKRIDYPGPDGRFLTVAAGDDAVEIILWSGGSGRSPVVEDEGAVVVGSVFLESDDLEAEFKVLQARGVRFVEPAPVHYPYGVRITALDPDGNRIELRQRNQG